MLAACSLEEETHDDATGSRPGAVERLIHLILNLVLISGESTGFSVSQYFLVINGVSVCRFVGLQIIFPSIAFFCAKLVAPLLPFMEPKKPLNRGSLLWTLALAAALLVTPKPRSIHLKQPSSDSIAADLLGPPRRSWRALQPLDAAADSAVLDYLPRLAPEQQLLYNSFSLLCLKESKSKFKARVAGVALEEMIDLALAAPMLSASSWGPFIEMIMELVLSKDRHLSCIFSLQERLAPFLSDINGESGDTAAAAEALAAASAAAAAAEGLEGGIDMEHIRVTWRELIEIATQELNLANTYYASAAEGSLLAAAPDNALWAELLQQVASRAAAAAAAARFGLTATLPDRHHEGTEAYGVAIAALVAVDDRIRLLLMRQEDAYVGSQPVTPLLKAALLSFCEPRECSG